MNSRLMSWGILLLVLSLCVQPLLSYAQGEAGSGGVGLIIENAHVKYVVGSNGKNLQFIDKQTGIDYCQKDPVQSFGRVKIRGKECEATRVQNRDGNVRIEFGESGAVAVLKTHIFQNYFTVEVLSVTGNNIEELQILNIPLSLKGSLEEPFSSCVLALNLLTNVPDLPGPMTHLRAYCYPRFGFAGAEVAVIGSPVSELRSIMKEVVSSAKDLPHSPVGGPWALDSESNRGSYLFITPTESNVEEVIKSVRDLGFDQVELHGGRAFRFGDCKLDLQYYPNDIAGLKATIEKLHSAGIKVIMHSYAFFIDKHAPWVTPIPDPRLAKDATFTLADSIDPDNKTVPVIESTNGMSSITGFFMRNSVTLQIDDELITYRGISKVPPYAFTECKRGVLGTQAAAHNSGARVHHLKECFGLFVPDPDSTLFEEVAAKNAELFNAADFDGIYLDALDGEDVLAGPENGWHYGSKFVFELWKRLNKPAMMEMSTFHHHLWYVRSRMGASDSPTRNHKKFIDMYIASTKKDRRLLLPSNMGWFAFRAWSDQQTEPTYPDDIEYLCAKALGTCSGLSINTYDPTIPLHQRLAAIVRRYENLRHENYFSESIKKRLRVPGDEFTLQQDFNGTWRFRPTDYARHKVTRVDGESNIWKVRNRYAPQPLVVRIEALMSAGDYYAEGNITLADFSKPDDFAAHDSKHGTTVGLKSMSSNAEHQDTLGYFSGYNSTGSRVGSWAKVQKEFSPPINLSNHQGLGIWVNGDGKGEVMNVQLRSPAHVSRAYGEHYILINFTGWRYFELIEPDTQHYTDCAWPYGGAYELYRESLNYSAVESLALWYNNLPPGKVVACQLRPIKAIPLSKSKIVNPTLIVNGKSISLLTEIESGCYLEFRSLSNCKLYGTQGQLLRDVKIAGEIPLVQEGDNSIEFTCKTPTCVKSRAYITVTTQGEPLLDTVMD